MKVKKFIFIICLCYRIVMENHKLPIRGHQKIKAQKRKLCRNWTNIGKLSMTMLQISQDGLICCNMLTKKWVHSFHILKYKNFDFFSLNIVIFFLLLQNDVEAAREAYDAFLSHYPYCYGYWRKYADYEKRKGSKKKCLEVSDLIKMLSYHITLNACS